MKIIKPLVEFYGAAPTDYENAIKFIERAGRTCYRSEDKITEDSAEKFVKKLIKAGHLAMVEHSNFVVRTPTTQYPINSLRGAFGPYVNVANIGEYTYIGGNITAWSQLTVHSGYVPTLVPFINQWGKLFGITSDDYSGDWQVCPHDEIPKELHRYAAKFICDRGVSHELVRHRPCSFAQESTRYVNYAGKDMEFIEPDGFESWDECQKIQITLACRESEFRYQQSIREGLSPQQARAVLPNALKTEIVVTADLAEWKHIFNLRCAPSAHPDMQRVMKMLRDKFIEEGVHYER